MTVADAKVESDIKDFGWHVLLVLSPDGLANVAYTIGLSHSYQHPEVVVLGLPAPIAHEVLNTIGTAVKNGTRFSAGDRNHAILVNHPSAFVEFPRLGYTAYLGYARRFYGGDDFNALQFIWPDTQGRFPWDADAVDGVRVLQAVRP